MKASKAMRPAVIAALTVAGAIGSATLASGASDGVQFLDPLTDEPLDVPLPEDASEAVQQFHQTGDNPYHGDEQAIGEGKRIYAQWCQACHLADGTGRIGPSLVDDQWKYPRTDTAVGQFEIIHAGGAGAMQAFGQRLSQDEILQVIAYMNQLPAQPGS